VRDLPFFCRLAIGLGAAWQVCRLIFFGALYRKEGTGGRSAAPKDIETMFDFRR
jgi:hypothetical protein